MRGDAGIATTGLKKACSCSWKLCVATNVSCLADGPLERSIVQGYLTRRM